MLQDGQEILEGRFMIVKKLGSGAFGEIYKGKYPHPPPHPSTNFTFDISSFLAPISYITKILLSFIKIDSIFPKFDITL